MKKTGGLAVCGLSTFARGRLGLRWGLGNVWMTWGVGEETA